MITKGGNLETEYLQREKPGTLQTNLNCEKPKNYYPQECTILILCILTLSSP